MIKTVALVVAAGRGQRFGGDLPKQYAPLAGHTVLYHTVSRLLAHPAIDAVKCVIHSDDIDLYGQAVEGLDLLDPVFGGATRQDSVRLGLQSLTEQNPELVLIHDAARPFVGTALIDGVIHALASHKGALPAVAVADTLKRGQDGEIVETVARHGLYRAQTPQGFHFKDILAAHNEFSRVQNAPEITDDAQLFELAELRVVLTPGDEDNFKITTQEDMMRAHNQLSAHEAAVYEFRTGQGFDVHRFGPGTAVTLCGVGVAHSQGLEGHSDADVALHALTDALLGAIGAGDIGQHFPPTEAKWKGAASHLFVAHARDLIHERGGEIVNVDITLICEAPKIGPHREAMVAKIADILNLAPDRVSVKATTTEGLGFTGRREGIGAQALATVRTLR
ncbi:bifunctional 2-C-methyl-D-erythritol 4-phosphate cytidylyltransferase/2-C-methyl-D-erythritol 2,4-cyclodiphosphate synthase [Magnetovibrio blakemorei]|uniref:Bifunctional enzyme IspD/IspF n=1 Tax=Magnetovibrio blakemorei TaxID=28181 RepID=A0A1E5Q4B6_9PROT|nr:bifunctional 2-C-methyl-D-erythritol 4-phosphate cytidylyltransferase/2-C-methyl-D-erythritol 2,4-cyclodiphosphate synthase [Magnetovibrio blakemorei]OEJ64627.1 bifunctional 2-C-methyl-D-erythritol 4-phosphate cytidylyltransferase/2-C-methyl-D-erythritol 2,4-cyclodiphosphate synthase [Magnetovibrio blakemorei]